MCVVHIVDQASDDMCVYQLSENKDSLRTYCASLKSNLTKPSNLS